MKRRLWILGALIFVGLLFFHWFGSFWYPFAKKNVTIYAKEILDRCAESDYRPSCYEREIPKLMGKLSMEEAFAVTKVVQDKDPQYVYCHVLAHTLSFKESAKNPKKWKDVLARCPVAMCNYGCLHGSLMQRFQKDTLTDEQIAAVLPDLGTVCEPRPGFSPSELDRTMCYHALGHLAMFITRADIPRATRICEQVSQKPDGRDYRKTCVEGVFMTVFQSIDPEDIALVKDIKPTKTTVAEFCQKYPAYSDRCRRESYALFREELQTPGGLTEFCSWATTRETQEDCYYAGVNLFAINAFEDSDGMNKVSQYCRQLSSGHQAMCFAGIAMRLVQLDPFRYVDTGVAICQRAALFGIEDECFRSLVSYGPFSFAPGTEQFRVYCGHLPDDWEGKCLTSS